MNTIAEFLSLPVCEQVKLVSAPLPSNFKMWFERIHTAVAVQSSMPLGAFFGRPDYADVRQAYTNINEFIYHSKRSQGLI